MERRKFIRSLSGATIGLATVSSVGFFRNHKKLTILHTNDTHSHIDPFPLSHSKYPGKGGVENRLKLIQDIRAQNKHVLLLDAGDIFQGTPYFNVHKGELELKLMTAMGYDAATMGNHDFDAGIDGFERVMHHAKFPFLCSNYDFRNTILKDKTKPYQIFKKGSIKVGVFGVGVELDGLVSPDLYKETQYINPIEKANQIANHLKKEEKCNLVICLSHLGYSPRFNKFCDPLLAKETEGIDLIIGGHSHTFMEKAEMHKNKNGSPVLINQVGWAGLFLGRIDFYFDEKDELNSFSGLQLNTNYELKT
ncbi:bifunctional metallophosphatase/5'-nucleotidase [Crocinitomix algicola]|uniref:bifunctional metallophosphatase/5'-nucleotidase n=1 Tax=Crocinitomix algicola TaxID=1740263 RepID=UPI000872CB84|nr:metallophosphatase [Crocinitomix algicola]